MRRVERLAAKVNGCEKIGSSPAPCSKNGEKEDWALEPHSSQRQRAEAGCLRLPRRMAKRTSVRAVPCTRGKMACPARAQRRQRRRSAERRHKPAARPARSVGFMRRVGRTAQSPYSTVTLFAKLRGWSTSHPRAMAISRANSCSGTLAVMALKQSRTFGIYIT